MAIQIYNFYTVTVTIRNTHKIRRGAACVERRTSGSEVGVRGRLRTYYNRLPWKQSANKIMLIG